MCALASALPTSGIGEQGSWHPRMGRGLFGRGLHFVEGAVRELGWPVMFRGPNALTWLYPWKGVAVGRGCEIRRGWDGVVQFTNTKTWIKTKLA